MLSEYPTMCNVRTNLTPFVLLECFQRDHRYTSNGLNVCFFLYQAFTFYGVVVNCSLIALEI